MILKLYKAARAAMKRLGVIAILLGGVTGLQVAQADGFETVDIGGVGNVRFMDDTHGYASGSGGSWAALSFEVIGMEPQGDGSIIATMIHDFVDAKGGWVRTDDVVVMQPIPDSPGVFSLAVTYTINEAGNGYEGFEGQSFNSRGVIDTNRGVANVRYEGSITRKKARH